MTILKILSKIIKIHKLTKSNAIQRAKKNVANSKVASFGEAVAAIIETRKVN